MRTIPPAFGERSLVNFGPLTTKYDMWAWTHTNRLFPGDYISALRGSGSLDY